MEEESEEEWDPASTHPPMSPTCGGDNARPFTTSRGPSRDAKARDQLKSRDFELATQTEDEEYLVAARQVSFYYKYHRLIIYIHCEIVAVDLEVNKNITIF